MGILEAVKAKHPLIWLVADDEVDVMRFLADMKTKFSVWSRSGLSLPGDDANIGGFTPPAATIMSYLKLKRPSYLVLPDAHKRLESAEAQREFKELVMACARSHVGTKGVVAIASTPAVPEDLRTLAYITQFPRPTTEDLKHVIMDVGTDTNKKISEDRASQLAFALSGLTRTEAELTSRLLLTSNKKTVSAFAKAKARQISAGTPLHWVDTSDVTLNSVGGMDKLKRWIETRAYALDAKSGLPRPRGILLCGIPGVGKSLVAKAISTAWGLPLLRFDIGAVFGPLVGASETNMRRALSIIDACSPCVVWIEELEKVTAGAQSSDRTDGGTTARVISDFLVWLQERESSAFVVGTINNADGASPEMVRKRRWDEVFWVDLPGLKERTEIFKIMFDRYDVGMSLSKEAIEISENLTGAEIEQAVVNAIFDSYADDAKLSSDHLVASVRSMKPQSHSLKIDWHEMLRKFAGASSAQWSVPVPNRPKVKGKRKKK